VCGGVYGASSKEVQTILAEIASTISSMYEGGESSIASAMAKLNG
jgi:hypothetical protein